MGIITGVRLSVVNKQKRRIQIDQINKIEENSPKNKNEKRKKRTKRIRVNRAEQKLERARSEELEEWSDREELRMKQSGRGFVQQPQTEQNRKKIERENASTRKNWEKQKGEQCFRLYYKCV